MKLIIVSGRSGSGKSICLKILEDLGYYCVDNLPVGLLPSLVNELQTHHSQLAVSIDARNSIEQLNNLANNVSDLRESNIACEVIFITADNDTLLQRYNETRRKHPLTTNTISLSEALDHEKTLLQPVASLADMTIDTSHLTMHQLRDLLDERLKHKSEQPALSLLFFSFGYKFGAPIDADYIFDVRCLPNPYWQSGLSAYSGKSEEVIQFLERQPKTKRLLNDIDTFLSHWIPHFAAANRRYLNIAIGCTGGQHRSVYIVEQLNAYFMDRDYDVQIRHRELP